MIYLNTIEDEKIERACSEQEKKIYQDLNEFNLLRFYIENMLVFRLRLDIVRNMKIYVDYNDKLKLFEMLIVERSTGCIVCEILYDDFD